MKHTILLLAICIVLITSLTTPALSQNGEPQIKTFTRTLGPIGAAGVVTEQGFGVAGVKVLDTMTDEVVKGAPFSGTLRTESTRTFADGNRIHQEGSSRMWRDKEGRVRTEADIMLPPGLSQDAPKLITISDPIAKVRYVLEPDKKIARKLPFTPELEIRKLSGPVTAAGGPGMMQIAVAPSPDSAGAPAGPEHRQNVFFYSAKGKRADDNAKSEDLGERDFDGVRATGTRLTTTIPAGEISNDRPIEIVSENWYAKSLKTTIMTKHSDPWAGDFTSRLIEISTNDPDPALFAVPAGYSVVEDKPFDEMLAAPPTPK